VAPMPSARLYVVMAVLDGKLYAVGGRNEAVERSILAEWYDLAAKAWEAVAPLATARQAHAAAVLDGKLYAVGGWDAVGGYDNGYLSSVERYDAATNAWEAVAPMATPRERHAVAVLDGKLYAVGGFNGGHLSSVERLPGAECVGGGCSDGDRTDFSRRGGFRRQAVRCWRVQRRRRPPQLGGAVRSRDKCVGGGGADGDGSGCSRHGGAQRQAVRRGRRRGGRGGRGRDQQHGRAVRPGHKRLGGGGSDGDGASPFFPWLAVEGSGPSRGSKRRHAHGVSVCV